MHKKLAKAFFQWWIFVTEVKVSSLVFRIYMSKSTNALVSTCILIPIAKVLKLAFHYFKTYKMI